MRSNRRLRAAKKVILKSCLLFALAGPTVAQAQYSTLWGRDGEHCTPQSRLPDFSYAGYHRGEAPLPIAKPVSNVKTFGAKGDGIADDTVAFQKAIDASKGKVMSIPSGRYKITDFLTIRASGTVLQGAGADSSVLFFPIPLNTIKPNWGATTTGQRTSNYSWSGGFLQVLGSLASRALAQVTAPAKRGDRMLSVSGCEMLKVGDDVVLRLTDTPDKSLATHLYAGDPGPLDKLRGTRESFACRVTKVDAAARRIEFDRPLRTDVRPEWQPTLWAAASSTEEVGIENLGFEFPNTPYQGHFTEVGYNAVAISGARNCWLRNLRIHNCDSGIFVSSVNVTVQGITVTSDRPVEKSRQATGHHGITLSGQDNLLRDFEFRTRFMHDITMTSGSSGNVVTSGRGLDLCFDHHKYGPHANLFCDLDLGQGSRMFQSGGGADLGRHSAAYETFWNIRARQPQAWPKGWGPDLMNLVGVQSNGHSETSPAGRWFEAIAPGELQPPNLYAAQLGRRVGSQATPGGH
jgi:Pectate lyase superfamily protein